MSDGGEKQGANPIAVVGFIILVLAGMLLAVYASRYVPQLLGNLTSAVYVSTGKPTNATTSPTPTVLPSAPTPAATTSDTGTGEKPTGGPSFVPTPTKTPSYTYTYPTGPRLYGYPDLSLQNVRVGYFSGGTVVADDHVPSGRDMGITFTVRNGGTNVVSDYLVRVRIEGQQDAIARGGLLYPNGYQNFTLRATDNERGNIRVSIEVDYPDAITETSESNNDYATDIDVSSGGSSSRDDISCDLSLSPSHIDEGDSATLRWETDGPVESARFNQGLGRVDEDGGSRRVSPDEDTTYRLTIEDEDGNDTSCSVTLRVD